MNVPIKHLIGGIEFVAILTPGQFFKSPYNKDRVDSPNMAIFVFKSLHT